MGIENEKFASTVDDDFICSICTLVLENPVRIAGCEHMFCRLCIEKWLKQDPTCPVDRKTVDNSKDLIAPDRTVVNMLNKLKIKCEFESLGCVDVVQLENWKSHVIECDFNPENKWPCVGCKKTVTRKEDQSHRCVEKLEIEIGNLKKENEDLKFLVKNFQTTSKKFDEENQKLKREVGEQNNLIKQLVDENENNQKKYKILLNENEALRLLPSTSTSLPKSIPPFIKTDNLVVKPKQSTSAKSNTESCSLHQTLEKKTTTSLIDKWLILSRLPENLKKRVQLASVLGTGLNFDAIVITKDDQAFWIKADKTTITDRNDGEPIKIDGLSKLKIKSLIYGGGIGPTHYLMALTEKGQLLTWSYSGHQLGGIRKSINKHSLTPTVINLNKKIVVQVVCSDNHALALTSDGQVYAWGDNAVGQLGTGTPVNQLQPTKVTVEIGSQRTVAVACCCNSSFALTDNGEVFAWGDNNFGQLGLNNNTNQTTPTKINELVGINIRRLTCGYSHVLAVADDGSMFAWGYNCNGQLGTGDKKDRKKPVKVGTPEVRFIEVAACNSLNHLSVALSENGRCWIWGRCCIGLSNKSVLMPIPIESNSIHDAIAKYAIYQMSWKTMIIRHQ